MTCLLLSVVLLLVVICLLFGCVFCFRFVVFELSCCGFYFCVLFWLVVWVSVAG